MIRKVTLPLALGIVAALMISGATLAQGFDAKLDLFLGASLNGAEEDLGSESFFSVESSEEAYPEAQGVKNGNGQPDFESLSNYDMKPIVLNPEVTTGSLAPLRLSLGYTIGQTRLGVSWFGVKAEANDSGSVPGLQLQEDEYGYSFGLVDFWGMAPYIYSLYGPSYWYEDVEDYRDGYNYTWTYDPDKGATTWSASQTLNLSSVYITAQHPIAQGDRFKVDLIGGFHRTDWEEGLDQHLRVPYHEGDIEIDEYESGLTRNTTWDTILTIDTTGKVNYQPQGVAIGIGATWQVADRLRISASALRSYLSGEATFSGSGIVVEENTYTETYTATSDGSIIGTPYIDRERASMEMKLGETTRKLNTTATQAEIGLQYDITDTIFVDGGLFYALWEGIPMAPRWYAPSFIPEQVSMGAAIRQTPEMPYQQGKWDLDRVSDISMSGWKLGVGVRF